MISNMNILILGNYAPPYGGVPNHVKLFSRFLSDRGHKIFVLPGGDGRYSNDANIEIHRFTLANKFFLLVKNISRLKFFIIFKNNNFSFSNFKYFLRLNLFYFNSLKIIKRQKIHCCLSYNLFYYSPVAFELYKNFKIPYVVNLFGEIYRLKEMRNNFQYYNQILTASFHNTSCSSHCANSIKLISNDINCKVVLYAIDLSIFKMKNSFGDRSRKIGFFGRLDTEMGLDLFLEIIKTLSHLNFDIIIAGQRGNYYEEVKMFQSLNPDLNIKIYSNVTSVELSDLYNECQLVLVPTRGERTCSSLAAMEAMACGCVVLGHIKGGIPELIIDGLNGYLIDYLDNSMFKDRIDYLINNHEKLNFLSSNANKYALENFGHKKMCITLYEPISNLEKQYN